MMKKMVYVFLCLAMIITGCSNSKYENRNLVVMEDCGTIMFPQGWEISREEDYYIAKSVEENKIKFIGFNEYDFTDKDIIVFEVAGYEIQIENRDDIGFCTSEVFSNSAIWGEKPIVCNDVPIENAYYIKTDGDNAVEWICVDDMRITDELVIDIAKSYVME